jgi:hypothetical protein
MDDGRIPLSPAQVVELGEKAQRRLSRIAGITLLIGAFLALGFVTLVARHRTLDAVRGLPCVVGLFGFTFERMAKSRVAIRAARLAKSDPNSVWFLDGYRVVSAADPKLLFRLSKKMLAELTAMPTATVVSK